MDLKCFRHICTNSNYVRDRCINLSLNATNHFTVHMSIKKILYPLNIYIYIAFICQSYINKADQKEKKKEKHHLISVLIIIDLERIINGILKLVKDWWGGICDKLLIHYKEKKLFYSRETWQTPPSWSKLTMQGMELIDMCLVIGCIKKITSVVNLPNIHYLTLIMRKPQTHLR